MQLNFENCMNLTSPLVCNNNKHTLISEVLKHQKGELKTTDY